MGDIDAVLIADKYGIPIYSKDYSNKNIDESLLLSFFSALKSFSNSFLQSSKMNELKSISLGNSLLDFETVDFDHIGQVDLLLISTGFDPTTSHAILSEITELFSIYLDEINTSNSDLLKGMKKGIIPNFAGFSPQLAKILDSIQTEDYFSMDFNLNIPVEALTIIDKLFENDLSLAKTYDFDGIGLLNQILSEYSQNCLEKDITQRFINNNVPNEKEKGKKVKQKRKKKK
ncbi:hypothetical protein DSAG12_00577 [Promethearchaeum syntrophicum]|uniref:Uncharacterized protein n=1 Tax=Promethearchaeum syntrophicum TaxID=2594042 RepID=A0A5B9D711_9ARCH|nr:hypothetical protein [Candidatus Prometheoarchaeum syntrophicum]QEE14761.1 hypothetical protein DSAG12_00577 [Candidatus Prometheoarchaeum syntrophicum]